MKVVQINTTCGTGSTGKICTAISRMLTAAGIENYILYTQGSSEDPLGIKYAHEVYKKAQALRSRVFGNFGFNSQLATRRLIRELETIQPDIVQIHNIHSHDCHIGMLFRYLEKKGTKVVWTFHDCWAFTGLCTYFDFVNCTRWKTGCGNCPQVRQTSWFVDRSRTMHRKKEKCLSNLNLTIVTPSQWLADLTGESFLKHYPVRVIPNGIDLSVFQPTENYISEKYNCDGKYIVLGVAFGWEKRKGLDDLMALARRLGSDYKIVLVGTDDHVDKLLPPNMVSIHRTQNQRELAGIYTAADVLVNPTREDNYPTVNMEALACGTPVITYQTGGSPEIPDATCGSVVAKDDLDALEKEIRTVCTRKPYSREACLKRAESFDQDRRFLQYLDLYRSLI